MYAKRDRHAKSKLKDRHKAEYDFYMAVQQQDMEGAAEKWEDIPDFTG